MNMACPKFISKKRAFRKKKFEFSRFYCLPEMAATVQPELKVTQSAFVVHMMCTIFA